MKRIQKISALAAAVALCVAACSGGGKVIPRKKMVQIYSEMFLADQWVTTHQDANMVADTTLFYEPIFNKYGYTTEDYRASVEHYLRDPIQFSRIVKEAALSLEGKAKAMKAQQEELQMRDLEELLHPEDE